VARLHAVQTWVPLPAPGGLLTRGLGENADTRQSKQALPHDDCVDLGAHRCAGEVSGAVWRTCVSELPKEGGKERTFDWRQ
jgi:hypothetical protein